MLPDLSVLFALMLGLGFLVEGEADPLIALAGTAATACVAAALSHFAGERGAAAARAGRLDGALLAAGRTTLLPLVAWGVCLYAFSWGGWVADAVPRTAWLGRYVVLFLPAAVLWATAWSAQGRIEAAVASAHGSLSLDGGPHAAVRRGLRRNGLALLPLAVLLCGLDGIWLLGVWGVRPLAVASRWIEAVPLLSVAVMIAVLALLTLFLPRILARVLRTVPLPAGPTRARLEEAASRLGLRYRDLVVWPTKGQVLNAMVVGYTSRSRVVFLTDALLHMLPEEEVLAVFAHEAGHARRHHLPLFLVLFAASALLFQVAGDVLASHGVDPFLVVALHLGFLWFVLLGAVSRLFEREADLFGATHAADLDPDAESVYVPGLKAPLPAGAARMIRALQRIRQISGRGASHRHGTIDERVGAVATWATDPEERARFARRKRRLLGATALLSALAVLATGARAPVDIAFARAAFGYEDAVARYGAAQGHPAGDPVGRRAAWRATYEGFQDVLSALAHPREPRDQQLRLEALWGAADTALRGLEDAARARQDFETLLGAIHGSELEPESLRALAFQTAVELGRLKARAGDLEGAHALLARADGEAPTDVGVDGAYFRARRALLLAAIEAARGDREAARARLEGHVLKASRRDEERWRELREDARAALEALGGAPPAGAAPEAGESVGEAPGNR